MTKERKRVSIYPNTYTAEQVIGRKLIHKEDGLDMGTITALLDDRVQLDNRSSYICDWALEAGFYELREVIK